MRKMKEERRRRWSQGMREKDVKRRKGKDKSLKLFPPNIGIHYTHTASDVKNIGAAYLLKPSFFLIIGGKIFIMFTVF